MCVFSYFLTTLLSRLDCGSPTRRRRPTTNTDNSSLLPVTISSTLDGRLPSMPSQRNSIPGPEAPQRRAYGASPRGRARDGVREHVPPRVWVLGKTLNCLVKCSKSQKEKWTSEPLPDPRMPPADMSAGLTGGSPRASPIHPRCVGVEWSSQCPYVFRC